MGGVEVALEPPRHGSQSPSVGAVVEDDGDRRPVPGGSRFTVEVIGEMVSSAARNDPEESFALVVLEKARAGPTTVVGSLCNAVTTGSSHPVQFRVPFGQGRAPHWC